MAEIIARVESARGACEAGHRTGDEFVIGETTPQGLCSWAFHTLFPFAEVLRYGGSFPWETDRDTATVACPDAANPVVFVLKRTGSR
jgi:uncharacterized repeat protein (TIGR04076 family)